MNAAAKIRTQTPAGLPAGKRLVWNLAGMARRVSRSRQGRPVLKSLLRGLPVRNFHGHGGVAVAGLCLDSRRISPGALFFALKGNRTDGNAFVHEVVHGGAVAIVSARPGSAPARCAYCQVDDVRQVMAQIARRFYDYPERALDLTGVTGTNGKTTVATLLRFLLEACQVPAGLLGTVCYDLGGRTLPAGRTTPEAPDIHAMLAKMRDAGCRAAVLEASSHGIDQHRVAGIPFKAAVFTNLTQDHIDYHQSIERYFAVKSRLFNGGTGALPEAAVINLDDPYGRRLAGEAPGDVDLVTYGEHPQALIRASRLRLGPRSSSFHLHWGDGESMPVSVPLLGRYNVSNTLAALAAGYALGHDPREWALRLPGFPGVPGRIETVSEGQPFNVLVDYAHTEDALKNVLGMLRAVTAGRLLLVFGCGGNRDRKKRPLMTLAALNGADRVWATADNPRGEPLPDIFADMKTGVTDPERIHFIEDRRRAIHLALCAARPGDCVLIAGKGHENTQEFASGMAPFDDRLTARELLRLKFKISHPANPQTPPAHA